MIYILGILLNRPLSDAEYLSRGALGYVLSYCCIDCLAVIYEL